MIVPETLSDPQSHLAWLSARCHGEGCAGDSGGVGDAAREHGAGSLARNVAGATDGAWLLKLDGAGRVAIEIGSGSALLEAEVEEDLLIGNWER